uniref:Uncharacterized protein n=1 Tax=Parascaris univalens TaxID=6257 RepID=A0A915AFD0_PARUN
MRLLITIRQFSRFSHCNLISLTFCVCEYFPHNFVIYSVYLHCCRVVTFHLYKRCSHAIAFE